MATLQANFSGLTDPLAQSFFVDSTEYADGLYISSIELYFRTKDQYMPVSIELRPMVNGYPSSRDVIPFSEVYLPPGSVNISDQGTTATKFSFSIPIYLASGEYAFIVKANSDKYRLFASELGGVDIPTGQLIDRNPYVGSLFKSQNASTWTATQLEDLKFKLNRCVFDTTTRSITANSFHSTAEKDYELVHLNMHALTPGTTGVTLEYRHKDKASSAMSSFEVVRNNTNILLPSTKTLTASQANSAQIRATLSTPTPKLSPQIDLSRFAGYYVKNNIGAYNPSGSPAETTSTGGYALAKYVTRKVSLESPNDDADHLRVYVDVARLQGTDFEVYYKILHALDQTPFNDQPWVLMTRNTRTPEYVDTDKAYLEFSFEANNIQYTGSGSGVYNSFKYFAIKIVMFSSNPAYVPKFKNLRAIAGS
jgi:hypothetical protein